MRKYFVFNDRRFGTKQYDFMPTANVADTERVIYCEETCSFYKDNHKTNIAENSFEVVYAAFIVALIVLILSDSDMSTKCYSLLWCNLILLVIWIAVVLITGFVSSLAKQRIVASAKKVQAADILSNAFLTAEFHATSSAITSCLTFLLLGVVAILLGAEAKEMFALGWICIPIPLHHFLSSRILRKRKLLKLWLKTVQTPNTISSRYTS